MIPKVKPEEYPPQMLKEGMFQEKEWPTVSNAVEQSNRKLKYKFNF